MTPRSTKRTGKHARFVHVARPAPSSLPSDIHQRELELQNRHLDHVRAVLEASRSRYADLYDFAPVGYLTLDHQGRITEANLTAASMLATVRTKLVGSLLASFASADHGRMVREHIRECVEGAEGSVSVTVSFVTTGDTQRSTFVAQLVSRRASEPGGEGGRPVLKTTLTDVTALSRAQERLRILATASKQLASTVDWLSVLPATLQLLLPNLANACVIELLDDEGQLGRVQLVQGPSLSPFLCSALRALPERRKVEELDKLVLGAARTFVHLADDPVEIEGPHARTLMRLCSSKAIVMAPLTVFGRPQGLLSLVLQPTSSFQDDDRTMIEDLAQRLGMAWERTRLHGQVTRMLDVRAELMASVSHDLKNPLAGVLFTTESLLHPASPGEGPPSSRHLERIRRAAYHMRTLVEDLSDFSSIEAGQFKVAPRQERIGHLLGECVDLFTPIAQQTGIVLEVLPFDEATIVLCDRERVIQVFSNLLGNALKFTPRGGRISLGVELGPDEVTLFVRDTGPGIPAEQLDHVFERYWQAEESARKGRGLGLYIARRIVEAQGGRIWAASEPPHGATFSFTLPRAPHKG